MVRLRLVFKLLIIYVVFTFALLVPIFLNIYKLLKQEGILNEEVLEKFYSDITGIVFYAFFIAFIISLVFARKILLPVKMLKDAAVKVKEGDLNVQVERISDDEIGEVTEVFNQMVRNLREKTEELSKKDLYVNTMMDALWVIDENNRIMDINPAFTKIFGYSKEEVIGISIYEFFDEQGQRAVARELETKRARGESSTYKVQMFTKDGRRIPVMITGAPIMKDDVVIGKIGVIKDISEVERLMKEIESSKEHLETIINSIEESFIVIDRDYRILRTNIEARRRYGEDIVGKKCFEVLHFESRPCWMEGEYCPVHAIFSDRIALRGIHQHYDTEGHLHFEEFVCSPVRDDLGNVVEVIQLLRDVTERIKKEEELKKRNAELELLNRLSSILASSLKADDVFSKVLDHLIETFDMDGGGFFLLDEKTKILTCEYHRGISEEFVREVGRVRLGEDIPGRVALTGQPVVSYDVSTDERVIHSLLKYSGIKGYCCIPVRGKERILGVFCLFKFRERHFTSDEERILASIGEITGLALDNIKLYDQMRSLFEVQRQRRITQQSVLLKLSSSLSAAVDINEVIESTVSIMSEYLMGDAIVFWELKTPEVLQVRYSKGISIGNIQQNLDILSPETSAIKNKKVYSIYDINEEGLLYYINNEVKEKGFKSLLCCPVMIGDRALGVLTILNRMSKSYQEEEIHFIRTIVSLFAVAYERSLFYEKSIIEKSLAESILNSISDGVCTIDTKGKILSANRAVAHILEKPLTTIVGKNYKEVLGEFVDNCPVEEALKGNNASGEMVFDKDGKRRIIQVNAIPLVDSNEKVYATVQVLRDVTREKELDRVKTEIIRLVSHEFRTPLSAIVGLTEMLIDGEVSDSRAINYLRIIYEEGLRLSEMVSQLLDISKLESGVIVPTLTPIDFKEIVEIIKKRFAERFEKKKAKFEYLLPDEAEFLKADKEMILQLLSNLIDNSLKYSDEGCHITLKVGNYEDYVIIEVTDTGWGIDEKDLKNLGEKFYRGKHGEKTKGTGLGLALCREIIKHLSGKMDIESAVGVGTTVRLYIPKEPYKIFQHSTEDLD